MQIVITGRSVEVTPPLRQYVEKKLARLDKFFPPDTVAQVAARLERGRCRVEVTIPFSGRLLRAEEETRDDFFVSVDAVVSRLEKQIARHKPEAGRRARRAAGRATADEAEAAPEAGDEDGYRVVRVKRFPLKPITVGEAIVQMNLLGHDFFVFANAESERTSVVYRRRDGHYGLIEPE